MGPPSAYGRALASGRQPRTSHKRARCDHARARADLRQGIRQRRRVGVLRRSGYVLDSGLGGPTSIGWILGFVPARHASRSDAHSGMQESSRRTAGSHQLTRRTLVVAEVALALVLLVSAGLLLR